MAIKGQGDSIFDLGGNVVVEDYGENKIGGLLCPNAERCGDEKSYRWAGDDRGENEDDVPEGDGGAGEVGEESRIGIWSRGWLAWMKVYIDLIDRKSVV